jgi:ADP-ribose pyrophosphatase
MVQGEVFMADSDRPPSLAREPWHTRSTRPVYENRWIRVREDVALLPDGRTTIYGVVECAECVGVLPFVDPDTVLLVGQHRYVAQGFYWEMPTGGMHAGESPEEAAQRELGEEAGCAAGSLVKICDFHTSKSILRETAHLYIARELRPASHPADPTEFIERRPFPFTDVLRMVTSGEIKDSMTVIAVLHAARLRGD